MAFFRARSTRLCRLGHPVAGEKVLVSASDSVNTRSLCPVRNSALSYAPPTAPPSTHAALSLTARYDPDGSAAVVPATLPVLAPARRDDKRRAASPTHNGILQENYLPLPQVAASKSSGSST